MKWSVASTFSVCILVSRGMMTKSMYEVECDQHIFQQQQSGKAHMIDGLPTVLGCGVGRVMLGSKSTGGSGYTHVQNLLVLS